MSDILLAAIILLPVLITYFFKSNAALAFLALCAGYTVESLAGNDINNSLSNMHLSNLSSVDVYLILLAAPPILTLFSSMRSWAGHSKMLMQMACAVATGTALVLIASPFIATMTDISVYNSEIWKNLQHVKSALISACVVLSLIVIWLAKTPRPDKKHHK